MSSLKFKLLALVMTVMLAMMALLVANLTLDAKRWSERERELRRTWVLQIVKTQLEGKTAVQSTDEMRPVMATLMRSKLIIGWAILDHKGKLLEKQGPLDLSRIEPAMVERARQRGVVQTEGRYLVAPIIDEGVGTIGTAQMRIEVPVSGNLPGQGSAVFLLMCLGTLVLLGVLYIMMSIHVLKPLERLARAADYLAAGKFDFSIEFSDRPDEIGQLLRAFRHMRSRLANYHEELQRDIDAARATIKKQERGLMMAQRLAATGTLAAGIAHEVNNPIGGMLNAAISLKYRHADDERTVQYLELIIEGLGRVRDTVSKVLQFTPREVSVGAVEFRQVIDSAVALAKHRLSKGQTRLTCDIPADLPAVKGNATELQQVMLNLTLNAVDAIEDESGTIEIVAEQVDDKVQLEIRDSGMGMTEEQLAKAFDLFYTTKEPGKGTGLGLSIVHDIVTRHHGEVEFFSTPGQGTTVRLVFPAYLDEIEAPAGSS